MAPTSLGSWGALALAGLIALTSLPAEARPNLLQPSARALAQGNDNDDPPLKRREPPVTKAEPPKVELDETPLYKKWWFWVLTAGVVGGVIAGGVLSAGSKESFPHACPGGVVLCFGDGRPR